ncbi:MAG TPA: hypothetical protein VF268_16915 [Gammaproteobacteria bacterium]
MSLHPDSYATAIPIDELAELARERAEECGARSEREIRQWAEHIVRSTLCPCTLSVDSVVDAVVEEFRRRVEA